MSISGLIPISLCTLEPSGPPGIDLYLRRSEAAQPKLFCAAHHPLEQADLNRLESAGITKLYIDRNARDQYQQYLRANLESWLEDASVPPEKRVGALNEVVRDVFSEAFHSRNVENAVDQAQQLGRHAAQLLSSEPVMFQQLMGILHHDYATFTHSANVSYYAVVLAKALGYSEDELTAIATGGLLHDLGKLEIDDRILTKPGRLDEHEFREIQKHPLTGFRKLCHREDLSWGQLMMVYQHHERVGGGGYPVGCPEPEIHPWARLCAVVDVFEALTSQRPYRSPMQHDQALQLMARDCGKAFDAEMFRCWEQVVLQNSLS